MWVFSTREVATAIFTAIFLLIILLDAKVRSSLSTLLKCAFSPKLVTAALFFLIYGSLFVVVFAITPLWKWIYLKDITFWIVFAGFPLCFNAISSDIYSGYFSQTIFEQLRFMVLVEFIISSFTFSLIAELFLVPITTFITLLDLIAGTKDELKAVKKLTSSILAIVGILIFIFTIKNIIVSYNVINITDMLVSFMVPIVFLFLYLPAAYIFVIYSRYESLFMRMSFKEPKNKRIMRWHHWEVIKACRFSYKKIDLFNQAYMVRMFVSMSEDSFRALMVDFKQNAKRNLTSPIL